MFQNSATGFIRPNPNNIEEKENMNEINRAAMMHRSDAMQYAPQNPLQQIRLNVLREANSFLPRNAQNTVPVNYIGYHNNNNDYSNNNQNNINIDDGAQFRMSSPDQREDFGNIDPIYRNSN